MNKKNITALLILMNLTLVVCVVILVVLNKSDKAKAPVTLTDRVSDEPRDVNPKPENSKPALKPEDIIACFGIGKNERRQKAIEYYGQIMRSEPPYFGELTEVYELAKNGQWVKAQAVCERSIQYSEDKREALYSLAWLYAKQGRYADAIKISNDLTANYPEFVKPYVTLGWIAAKEGRKDDAVSACKTLIKLAPAKEMGYYGLGRLYALLDEPNEAIAAYSQAIQIKPDFAEAYLFLGLVYSRQGQWPEAAKAFGSAVSIDRSYEQAQLFLAVAYDELGLYREASEAIEQAVGLGTLRHNTKEQWRVFGIEPDYARFNCMLAEAYARTGKYQKAVFACEDAIAINPAFSEAYYNMALAYLLLGNKDLALQQRDKLVSMKANDMVAKLDELFNK